MFQSVDDRSVCKDAVNLVITSLIFIIDTVDVHTFAHDDSQTVIVDGKILIFIFFIIRDTLQSVDDRFVDKKKSLSYKSL